MNMVIVQVQARFLFSSDSETPVKNVLCKHEEKSSWKKIILIITRQHLFDTDLDMIQYQTLNGKVWTLLKEFSLKPIHKWEFWEEKKKIKQCLNSPS